MQDGRGKDGRAVKIVLSILVAAATILADQIAKRAVVTSIIEGDRVPVLGNFFRLSHITNPGAVFGVMSGAGTYFTVFSIFAGAVLLVVIFFSRKSTALVRISLGMVLGGALGNLIDRIRFGAVVDFLDIGFGESARWPSFNIADAAITVGVVLLIGNTLRTSGTSDEGDEIDSRENVGGEDRPVPE
jgi:signal peptidase II